MKLVHIVHAGNSAFSDQQSSQLVFESLATAKRFAKNDLAIDLVSTQFHGNQSALSTDVIPLRTLERCILDYIGIRSEHKLPFLKDILDRACEYAAPTDYIIYSNADISPQPHFYLAIKDMLENQCDALAIKLQPSSNRILKGKASPPDQLGSQGAYCCFIFTVDMCKKFILDDVCTGAPLADEVLLANIMAFSSKFALVEKGDLDYFRYNGQSKTDTTREVTLFNCIQAISALTKLQKVAPNKLCWEGSKTMDAIKKYLEANYK